MKTQTAFRLSKADLTLLDRARKHYKLETGTETLRVLLRLWDGARWDRKEHVKR